MLKAIEARRKKVYISGPASTNDEADDDTLVSYSDIMYNKTEKKPGIQLTKLTKTALPLSSNVFIYKDMYSIDHIITLLTNADEAPPNSTNVKLIEYPSV